MHCMAGYRGGSSLPPSSGRFSSRPPTSLCDEPAQRSHLFVQPRCREILRGQHAGGFSEIQCNSPHPPDRVSYASMGDFYSDLKSILGLRMLWEVVLGVRRNDLLGLAGQLAYFFLLFFFPFLIFLVSLTGLVIGNPEAGLKSLFEALSGLVPANARTLVVDYVDSTLRTANTSVLLLGILGALWLGQAASISITKAANRSSLLPPPGESAVLAVARRLPDHNLGIHATHRGPDPRGVQHRSLRLGYSRVAGRRHEPR